jgi:hypothetical protein
MSSDGHLKYDGATGNLLRAATSGHLIYDCTPLPPTCSDCAHTPTQFSVVIGYITWCGCIYRYSRELQSDFATQHVSDTLLMAFLLSQSPSDPCLFVNPNVGNIALNYWTAWFCYVGQQTGTYNETLSASFRVGSGLVIQSAHHSMTFGTSISCAGGTGTLLNGCSANDMMANHAYQGSASIAPA